MLLESVELRTSAERGSGPLLWSRAIEIKYRNTPQIHLTSIDFSYVFNLLVLSVYPFSILNKHYKITMINN